ncbi:MAG: NAD(P)/FAD-dependent oxidoreductase [Bacteroidales bacterium]|nr:NAD(P)/FAD-dependent oxidoreductase [Bacteroidales bacterium]
MKQKIIVIGAGFAGIQFVRKLDEKLFDILLIDKINHHQFQPLFYQVATSQIEPSSISFPIRHIFKNKSNVRIRLATLRSIDAPNRKITTSIGDFEYDYLVIATGCKTNFFGNKEIETHAFSLKSTYNSITIRNHILQTFEKILSASENEKEGLFNLVIVGAGPTGVELAGAFAEIKKNILPKDYPRIDFSQFKIILIEGSKFTLSNMSDNARKTSKKYLEKMGATILTEVFVKNYDGHLLTLSNQSTIKTETVIWAAGVIGETIPGIPVENIARGNRIIVDRMNKSKFNDTVFAVGDIAYMETPKYPNGHPQVANVAINQAINLAKNMNRLQKGKKTKLFEYKDMGSLATIGRNKAVVDFPFVKFKGYFAWLIWMFLHLMLILSVRNKLIIFINWALEYVTKDTSLRLILTDSEKK